MRICIKFRPIYGWIITTLIYELNLQPDGSVQMVNFAKISYKILYRFEIAFLSSPVIILTS